MKKDKIELVYIVGCGHSGSTLLEMLLGTSKDIFPLGEFSFFNYKFDPSLSHEKSISTTCTCGKEYEKCPFWIKSLKGVDVKKTIIKKKFTKKEVYSLLATVVPFRSYKDLTFTQSADYELFSKIKAQTSSRYLLDSSKDPRRIIQLMKDERISIKPIFLIRDGRAYANSYNRKSREELGLKRKNYYKALFEWIGLNMFMFVFFLKFRKQYLKVSYDNFCKDPDKELDKMAEFLEVKLPKDYLVKVNDRKNYHNIAGNQLRFKPIKSIKYDSRWKKEQPFINRVLGTLITFPFNLFWTK